MDVEMLRECAKRYRELKAHITDGDTNIYELALGDYYSYLNAHELAEYLQRHENF